MNDLDPLPTYAAHVHRLDATLAELRISFAGLPPDIEVRGRLMGPRCAAVSTVEIAYPLQKVGTMEYRVLIPEPVCWTEKQPFVYEGPVEFLQEGQRVGRLTVSVGVKEPRTK